jgi:CDP-diacylglycerol--glycerol-3-phosphate 3-phosphatidyltransferase
MKSEERFWNIPNTLSLYRLLSFPALLTFIIIGHERLFVIFLVAGLVTDVLDGLIARTFNMQTKIGARLDSTADLGIFISAFLGIYTFKRDTMSEHLWLLITFIIFITLMYLIALIKFGKFPGLHLYSFKGSSII